MKTCFFLTIYIFLLISLSFAEKNESKKLFKFGISATLEKSSDIYTDGFHSYTNIGFSKILLPVIFKSLIKIVPEIGYRNRDSKEMSEYTLWQIGIGIFYFYQFNDINIYSGPRIGFEKLKSTLFSTDDEMLTNNFINYGLTIGSEYFFSENFSIGSELQINKYIFNDTNSFEIEISHLSLVPVLYLSFYLK